MFILMKQYGRTVIICVTAVLVLGILFRMQSGGKMGFIALAYEMAMGDFSDRNPAGETDTNAVKAAAARKKPETTYTYVKTVPKAEMNLEAMFKAKDAEGNPIAIEITDILNPAGDSILYLTKEDRKLRRKSGDTKRFLFANTGIYTIYVRAVDTEKKQAYGQYRLPVTTH